MIVVCVLDVVWGQIRPDACGSVTVSMFGWVIDENIGGLLVGGRHAPVSVTAMLGLCQL